MSKLKTYRVYIKQEYEPIVVKADNHDDAIYQVENNMSWGEPIGVEIIAEEN
jgi:hypothetical protein